jgi:hypothetical protein
VDTDYSPPRPKPHQKGSGPTLDHVGVGAAELIRMRDEHNIYMELVRSEGNVPPGASAMHDHLLGVLDRALRGTANRHEVEELIEASTQFAEWRQDKGYKLSPSAEAIRNRALDVLRRLAAALPEKLPRVAEPNEDVGSSTEAMMITVEAFAHAIGKSPRTVYRMAGNGQLLVYREGVGRGTVLIYRDQVDPANRPQASATAQRRRPPSASRAARSS